VLCLACVEIGGWRSSSSCDNSDVSRVVERRPEYMGVLKHRADAGQL